MGPSLTFERVSKRFGGVTALSNVSLQIAAGSCHALMGENGAGKSTLARIAAGIHRPEGGRVLLDGEPVRLRSPADAQSAGVALVHQELAGCDQLSVAENLCLGRWPTRGLLLDRRAQRARARELLSLIGAELDVDQPLGQLSVAQEQLVQIAAAVGTGARLLLLDEPTSALSGAEAQALFELMGRLRARGTTLVYVSHRLPEVLALCDAMTVLRDGQVVGTLAREDADEPTLVRMMLGRELQSVDAAAARARADGVESAAAPPAELAGAAPLAVHAGQGRGATPALTPPALSVRGLTSPAGLHGVDLQLHPGEVLGLAGLVGSGRSELLAALFGLDPHARGDVSVGDTPLRLGDPRRAIAAGLGLVPEDRKRQGLVLGMDALANQSLAHLHEARSGLLLDRSVERARAHAALDCMDVRGQREGAPVSTLSGGNQQKVLLARWIDRGVRVLLLDEPTRGVDVGAKAAIHSMLRQLAQQGLPVLLVSSDLPELLALSDRVDVLREGRVVAQFQGGDRGGEQILEAMLGATRGRTRPT